MAHAWRWIRSLAFIAQMYLMMLVLAIAFGPFALISREWAFRAVHAYCNWVRMSARWMVGLRSEIRGDVPRDEVLIAAKHQSESASGWLSAREIQRRGYFGGELSTLNLLAHTCCHEFAHLLQQSAGQRYRGSVHNRHFYTILDELHESGAASAARDALAEQARHQGLALPDTRFEPVDTHRHLARWQVGDTVCFGAGRRELQGEIIRVNRKTCTVEGIGPSRGVRYRVPVQMLSPLTPPR